MKNDTTNNANFKYWCAFGAIVCIGILSGGLFFERSFPILENRVVRYALLFLMLLLITAIGYYAWGINGERWIQKLWLYIYISSIAILIVAGLIDLFVYSFPYAGKKDLHHFRTLMLTPLPFLFLYLLQRFSKRVY